MPPRAARKSPKAKSPKAKKAVVTRKPSQRMVDVKAAEILDVVSNPEQAMLNAFLSTGLGDKKYILMALALFIGGTGVLRLLFTRLSERDIVKKLIKWENEGRAKVPPVVRIPNENFTPLVNGEFTKEQLADALAEFTSERALAADVPVWFRKGLQRLFGSRKRGDSVANAVRGVKNVLLKFAGFHSEFLEMEQASLKQFSNITAKREELIAEGRRLHADNEAMRKEGTQLAGDNTALLNELQRVFGEHNAIVGNYANYLAWAAEQYEQKVDELERAVAAHTTAATERNVAQDEQRRLGGLLTTASTNITKLEGLLDATGVVKVGSTIDSVTREVREKAQAFAALESAKAAADASAAASAADATRLLSEKNTVQLLLDQTAIAAREATDKAHRFEIELAVKAGQLSEATTKATTAETALRAVQKTLIDLQTTYDALVQSEGGLKEEIARASGKATAQKNEIAAAKKRVSELEDQVRVLENEKTGLEEIREEQGKRIAGYVQANKDLTTRATKAERELSTANAALQLAEESFNEAEKEVARLAALNKVANTSIVNLRGEVAQVRGEKLELQERQDTLNANTQRGLIALARNTSESMKVVAHEISVSSTKATTAMASVVQQGAEATLAIAGVAKQALLKGGEQPVGTTKVTTTTVIPTLPTSQTAIMDSREDSGLKRVRSDDEEDPKKTPSTPSPKASTRRVSHEEM